MPQSLSLLLIHVIFTTKYRQPFLREELCCELHPYLAETLKSLDSPAIEVGSADDHVHTLFKLSRKLALCRVVEKLKTGSSKWIKTKGGLYVKFHWQSGYGAFSVGPSDLEAVRTYIFNQREHHRTRSFQEEYRKFLKEYNIPYDERFVWD
jgi:putative transposase